MLLLANFKRLNLEQLLVSKYLLKVLVKKSKLWEYLESLLEWDHIFSIHLKKYGVEFKIFYGKEHVPARWKDILNKTLITIIRQSKMIILMFSLLPFCNKYVHKNIVSSPGIHMFLIPPFFKCTTIVYHHD